MGTNYYLNSSVCAHCGRGDNGRHIGKSSYGWCFSLRIYPKDNINNWQDWLRLLQLPASKVFDEYGAEVPTLEFISIVTERSHPEPIKPPSTYTSLAPAGIQAARDKTDLSRYLTHNHATLGPRNLLRHRFDPPLCVPGEGTYDYCDYEFC